VRYDSQRLDRLIARERDTFARQHARSAELHERALGIMPGGVPMGWMAASASPFPPYITGAHEARLTDIDGHTYADFALSEGAALGGHAPPALVDALTAARERGIAHMLPTEDALWVAEELGLRFGLPSWHFAVSATDANRFALRLARQLTGRPTIVVFGGYYHGTLDEATGDYDPRVSGGHAAGAATRVIDFNDLDALEAALAQGDVACVLAEPALTNVGLVSPLAGYHAELRAMTRATGTLLILDESHTFAAGPGGATAHVGLEPDMLTIGKALGGGVPAAAYGFSAELGHELTRRELVYTAGVGGTLAGSALALAAVRATLEHVLNVDGFQRAHALSDAFVEQIGAVITERRLDWHVAALGCRVDYTFAPSPPRNANEARASMDNALSLYLRLFELNRGVLLTPFLSNTALISPVTRLEDVQRCADVLNAALGELLNG
jgi:glutamate-1-semialdehyde 2,1-aminomutase